MPQGNRGPWNTEKIWAVPGPEGTPPAYVVPPLAHFGNGPAGITHYPGVGLDDRFKDHFFACDFTANANNSKIWTVAVKPKGASFEVTKPEVFVAGMVPTDCEFGPDGAFYWSRAVLIPLLIIFAKRPLCRIPKEQGIDDAEQRRACPHGDRDGEDDDGRKRRTRPE